jgi:hypothetical protein
LKTALGGYGQWPSKPRGRARPAWYPFQHPRAPLAGAPPLPPAPHCECRPPEERPLRPPEAPTHSPPGRRGPPVPPSSGTSASSTPGPAHRLWSASLVLHRPCPPPSQATKGSRAVKLGGAILRPGVSVDQAFYRRKPPSVGMISGPRSLGVVRAWSRIRFSTPVQHTAAEPCMHAQNSAPATSVGPAGCARCERATP